MQIHYKKPITVQNNTHYFDPEKTKIENTFINPRTYWARKNKIEGYENRLYWEWKDCNENNGQTFFYTLTYNNKNIPKYLGENCFNYEDLRQLLTGGFNKNLLRNYGTKLKYFVGAELGEGKGSRGNKNNPHYHILFFLRDAKKKEYPYRKIDPVEFRSLIRQYWQGTDQDKEGFSDYRKFKKGIAKEGENNGLVTDYRAVMYCAKYVTKDIGLIQRETKIAEMIRKEWHKKIYSCAESYERFWKEEIVNKYNIPKEFNLEEEKEYLWTSEQVLKNLGVKELGNTKFCGLWVNYAFFTIEKLGLQQKYKECCDKYLEEKIKTKINDYRNKYCNKCRISHGVGESALKAIKNTNKPKIGIYTATGYKERDINLYYFRKIYCDIVKDATGNNKYILNEKGIEYLCNKVQRKIEELEELTLTKIGLINEETWNEIIQSDINTKCTLNWNDIQALKNYENKREIARRYSIFKLVYEGRWFKMENNRYPEINPISDYRNFLEPTFKTSCYRIDPVRNFLENDNEGYMAYNTLPYFLQDWQYYTLFDTLADYYFIQTDNMEEQKKEEIRKIKTFHKILEFKKYLTNLK